MTIRCLLPALVLGFCALGAFAQEFPREPGVPNVTFAGESGAPLKGYLALPPGSDRRPGVLLIHEWWGLNTDITRLADALASEGFVVLAADGYRGRVAQDPATAQSLAQSTAKTVASDLDAAYRFLSSQARVIPGKVASWGFCYGGSQSQRLATRTPGLAAAVVFYGGGPPQNPEDLGVWAPQTPFLGIYGKKDSSIPFDQIRAFETALESRGIPATVTRYPDVGHAFVKSTTYNHGGAAERAWHQAVTFLKVTLGS